MALLEFLLTATWAGIVPADILQRIAHRLMVVTAMRAVNMPVVVIMIVVMVAIGAMDMRLLSHGIATPE